NIEAMFRHRNDVCIAIDLFWYPVQGRNDIRHAPDVMVALGRPKGHRFPAYLELREALERAVEQARLEAEQERRLREQERQIREREARRALEAERRLQQERQRAEQAEAELQRLR
ncbi:MAG: hypothetical protein NZM05_12660, partial [Chloroherpetonaceae bacterium]|nr:hypothetical protein [Chloroherpetonaceae bacterium]